MTVHIRAIGRLVLIAYRDDKPVGQAVRNAPHGTWCVEVHPHRPRREHRRRQAVRTLRKLAGD